MIGALKQDPSDEATWAVRLDRLRDRDDPIAIVADAEGPRLQDALREHASGWFGRPVDVDEDGVVSVRENERYSPGVVARFRRGHVARLEVDLPWNGDDYSRWPGQSWIPELLQHLLAQPVAQLIHTIDVRLTSIPDFSYEGLIEAITAHAPLAVRELYVGQGDQISWTTMPDIGSIWAAAPWLRGLTFEGSQIHLGSVKHARLQRLTLISGGLPREPIEALVSCNLPALADLELWFGDPGYGAECDVDTVRPLLARPFPQLRRMGLVNSDFADRLVEHLPSAVWLPQLQRLALSGSTLTDAGAERILANAEAYAHLVHLDLGQNYLSAGMAQQLKWRFGDARLDVSAQQVPSERGGQLHYYVSVGE